MAQLQLLLFSGLAFFVMLPLLKRTPTITLDSDWLWRRLLPALAALAERLIRGSQGMAGRSAAALGTRLLAWVERHHGLDARMAQTWTTRGMAMWVLVLLLGYLVLYYLRGGGR